jgi:hypothetical protein
MIAKNPRAAEDAAARREAERHAAEDGPAGPLVADRGEAEEHRARFEGFGRFG